MKRIEQKREANVNLGMSEMTHPFVVENGDLFSSIDGLVTADALADELQDCVAVVAPTTF